MKEVMLPDSDLPLDAASFLACIATILELPLVDLPALGAGEDPAAGWTVSRWLGGLGLGLVRIADPSSFSWAGPWIARVCPPGSDDRRSVVMYGVPSGVVWDPAGGAAIDNAWIEDGFLIAAADIALALPLVRLIRRYQAASRRSGWPRRPGSRRGRLRLCGPSPAEDWKAIGM